MVRLTQIVHLSYLKISTITQTDWNELPFEPHHRVPSGVSKMIFEPMVCLVQTVYLTLTLTPSLNRPMRDSTWPMSPRSSIGCVQKWFPSLMVHWRKVCNYLTSRLALSPNGLKRAFTRTSSPRSTIRGVQRYFWANGTFGTNRAPIMPQD
jgi:hypothetical protein